MYVQHIAADLQSMCGRCLVQVLHAMGISTQPHVPQALYQPKSCGGTANPRPVPTQKF